MCKFFGISKYTLYSYIDEAKGGRQLKKQRQKPAAGTNNILLPYRPGHGTLDR